LSHCLLVSAAPAADLAAPTRTFLETHCYDCHDAETKKGSLDLTSLAYDPANRENAAVWVTIHDRVADGEMPPAKKKTRPDAAAIKGFTRAVGGPIADAIRAGQDQAGRVRARRLNRAEFEHSLHDLLGINVPLAALLPADAVTDGFDNQAEGQSLSPGLVTQYLEATDLALEKAFALALKPAPLAGKRVRGVDTQPSRFEGAKKSPQSWKDLEAKVVNGDTLIRFGDTYHKYGMMKEPTVGDGGRYRIRFRAYAVNTGGRHLTATLGTTTGVDARPNKQFIGVLDLAPEPREFTFELWLEYAGKLLLRSADSILSADGKPLTGERFGVGVEWVEISPAPAGPDAAATQRRLFGELKVQPGSSPNEKGRVLSESPERDLQRLMLSFAIAAFRSHVTETAIAPYTDFARGELKAGLPFEEALRGGYRALLTSPRFLYFQEKPGVLDSHALASRLSYFLTGSLPDAPLRAAADDGSLSKPEVLRAQVDRLLAGDGARAFSQRLAAQWLNLRDIEATLPDGSLYPEFDPSLLHAMQIETPAFLAEMFKSNLGVADFIRSDFAMLNERLARHYGIQGPGGMEFQKVSLPPESPRGGLLSQASVLKVTANGTTTSPVLRGAWVLERILGQRVPPPPANVPAVEPDTRGTTTIREQLDKHRNDQSCASCHAKIDPPGFALESFDVIGGWREHYRKLSQPNGKKNVTQAPGVGLPVDAHGQFADGRAFKGWHDFRGLLLENEESIARNFTAKLITFATGAGISFADREVVESIVAKTKVSGYGVRSLLQEVVLSRVFTHK